MDLDVSEYMGEGLVEFLESEGAGHQQARDLAASIATLNAMHMARWEMGPLDWSISKYEYGSEFRFEAYAQDNLCQIMLTA